MNLDDAFWPALWSLVALPSGTRPEIFLAVWLLESGLDPSAQNARSGCTGLNQTCPAPNGPGFPPGHDAASFRAVPASEQLAWIAPQVMKAVALNGGPFLSAARYYQANFLPATLPTVTRPTDVLAGAGGPYAQAYAWNRGLDVNRDGVITLDDLGSALERHASASGRTLQDAIAETYRARPPGAPWDAPDLVLYPPGGGAPTAMARAPGGMGLGLAVAGACTLIALAGTRR